MAEKIYNVSPNAGIKRDGTQFDANEWSDGVWCRFQRGRPRKIWGYSELTGVLSGPSRGMFLSTVDGTNMLASGNRSGVDLVTFDIYGSNVSSQPYQFSYDIPAGVVPDTVTTVMLGANQFTKNPDGSWSYPSGVTPPSIVDDRNLWTFDVAYSPITGKQSLLAHPGLNLNDITSDDNTPVFFGALDGTSPLYALYDLQAGAVATTLTAVPISVSGGCKYLSPFIFVYGSGGLIKNCHYDAATMGVDPYHWSGADYPLANEQNVGPSKVVASLAVRGGANSPSGLFWSLDSLTRVSFASGNAGNTGVFWRYDPVSQSISVLSSQSIVEIDGIYYWPGNDRWYLYNGVVRDIPNEINFNYFFDGLNYNERQKIWGQNNPRWGEIWFYYPKGENQTECNDAIIYNYREQLWYDAGGADGTYRSSGAYSQAFRWPVACDYRAYQVAQSGNPESTVDRYSLFRHEFGRNKVQNGIVSPIYSSILSCDIGYVGQSEVPGRNGGPFWAESLNRWCRIVRVEPDFNQSGAMSLFIEGNSYANDVDIDVSDEYIFYADTSKIDLREQRRLLRFRFVSNVIDGDYEAGKIMFIMEEGDERGNSI